MNPRMESLLKKYRSLIIDGAIYFAPYIPEKKLQNVLQSYAKEAQQEEILLLVDNTTFGSAKDGGLLTDQAFYTHNILEAPQRILLEKIHDVTTGEKRELREIYINGNKFLHVDFASRESTQHLISLLQKIAHLSQKNAFFEEDLKNKASTSPKILEKDLQTIQDLRRGGATPRKFWEFILQHIDRQHAWEIQPQGVLDVQIWKYLLSEAQPLLFNYWNNGYEQTAPGSWWDAMRFLPADPRAEAFCYFSFSALLPFERALLRILLQTNLSSFLYIAPYIPEKKIKNARETCQIPSEETIFGLFDFTLFGSAKNGAVFGEKHFYLHNSLLSRRPGLSKIPYEEFREREFQVVEREVSLGYSQFIECSGADPEIVSDLFKKIKSAHLQERQDIPPEKAIASLLHLLKNGIASEQKLAAWALTFFPKKAFLVAIEEALFQQVQSSDLEVQLCCILALSRLGPTALSSLSTLPNILNPWDILLRRISLSLEQWNAFQEVRKKASYDQLELEIINATNTAIQLKCQDEENIILEPEHTYSLYLTPGYEMTYVAKGVFFCGKKHALFWPADSFLPPHSRIEWVPEKKLLRAQGERVLLYNKTTKIIVAPS